MALAPYQTAARARVRGVEQLKFKSSSVIVLGGLCDSNIILSFITIFSNHPSQYARHVGTTTWIIGTLI